MTLALLPAPMRAFYEYQRADGPARESFTVLGFLVGAIPEGDQTLVAGELRGVTWLLCLNAQRRVCWMSPGLTIEVPE